MQWTNGAHEESWTFASTTLSEMSTIIVLPTSHHFLPLSPVVSLSLGILHERMRTQMLAKPSLNLLQRTTTGAAARDLDDDDS